MAHEMRHEFDSQKVVWVRFKRAKNVGHPYPHILEVIEDHKAGLLTLRRDPGFGCNPDPIPLEDVEKWTKS